MWVNSCSYKPRVFINLILYHYTYSTFTNFQVHWLIEITKHWWLCQSETVVRVLTSLSARLGSTTLASGMLTGSLLGWTVLRGMLIGRLVMLLSTWTDGLLSLQPFKRDQRENVPTVRELKITRELGNWTDSKREINVYPVWTFLCIQCIGRGTVLFGSKWWVNTNKFPGQNKNKTQVLLLLVSSLFL